MIIYKNVPIKKVKNIIPYMLRLIDNIIINTLKCYHNHNYNHESIPYRMTNDL